MCFYVNAKGEWVLERIVVDLLVNVVEIIKTLKPPCMASKTYYLSGIILLMSVFQLKILISNCLMLILFKNLCCLKTFGVGMSRKGLYFIYEKLVIECSPTNELRFWQHMTNDVICLLCKDKVEDVMHALKGSMGE